MSTQSELIGILKALHPGSDWVLRTPASGTQREAYIATGATGRHDAYFVKINANVAAYEAASSLGITPPTIATDTLANGSSVLVQQFVNGQAPSWSLFQSRLDSFAAIINLLHHAPRMREVLADTQANSAQLGAQALHKFRSRWQSYRSKVPQLADETDALLAKLAQDVGKLQDGRSVPSHNDLNSSNWLIADTGDLYLLDFDMLTLDDPAQDMGMLLWWYYPPAMRTRFLKLAGHEDSKSFRERMRIRMTLHSLSILLPRPGSFDQFDADRFTNWYESVRAVYAGKQNPRGYDD